MVSICRPMFIGILLFILVEGMTSQKGTVLFWNTLCDKVYVINLNTYKNINTLYFYRYKNVDIEFSYANIFYYRVLVKTITVLKSSQAMNCLLVVRSRNMMKTKYKMKYLYCLKFRKKILGEKLRFLYKNKEYQLSSDLSYSPQNILTILCSNLTFYFFSNGPCLFDDRNFKFIKGLKILCKLLLLKTSFQNG